jgi:dolichol-phosphate mannosyltransferase
MEERKKIAVIPTYNERENLEAIVKAVLAADPNTEVLIVDDNSPDGTGQIADELSGSSSRIHVLHRGAKEGIGPAYKDGFRRALELGADLVVQMDADFSHSPEDLPRFFEAAGDHDVILGSRYVEGITVVNWPMERLMLSYFGNRYARKVLGGVAIEDLTGGFKCWRREVLEAIDLKAVRSNGYAFQIEMSYRAWRMGYRLKEIPIIFRDRTQGDSKMNKRIAVEALGVVWWLRLQNLLGRLETRGSVRSARELAS